MYQPKKSPISTQSELTHLPDPFSLICWNLHKIDFSQLQPRNIEQLLGIEDMHVLSLQEARVQKDQSHCFGLPFMMSPNIQTRSNTFGAITASAYQQKTHHQFITRSRELGFTTHKSAITTQFLLTDNSTLTHVNIHAINFVPLMIFKRELQLLLKSIQSIEGPLILSGDFNTWNKARVKVLNKSTQKLGLTQVKFDDQKPIKTLNRQPLDHVFYRGLKLLDSRAINVPKISDHNPIIAQFTLCN